MSVSDIRALLGCDRVNLGVTLAAAVIALGSARPYAGSWNDGSRLLLHNLPLLLVLPASVWLLRQRTRETAEVWFAIAFSTCSWLIYAVTSSNHGGVSCSVRWFVPLLTPGYLILVLLLRHRPSAEIELRVLAIGATVLGPLMWSRGPWNGHLVPGYWLIVGATCLIWIILRVRSRNSLSAMERSCSARRR